jgi:hypothetical protein
MFAAGAFRVAVVAPRLSAFGTEVVGALLGIAVILILTGRFIRSLERPTLGTLAGIGLLWLGLTVAFEFGFFHYVGGRTWASLVRQYDIGRVTFGPSCWPPSRSRHSSGQEGALRSRGPSGPGPRAFEIPRAPVAGSRRALG